MPSNHNSDESELRLEGENYVIEKKKNILNLPPVKNAENVTNVWFPLQ